MTTKTTEDAMLKWKYPGVLLLSLMIGACTPDSKDQYANEALETQANRHLMVFVDHSLKAANQGIMELEQEAGVAASEADTMMTKTVAELRSEYQELSEEADSLLASADSTLETEGLELRDKLVNLTKSVEKTRFEIIDESDEYRQAVNRRLSELDQRLYELTTDIEQAGLSQEFDGMVTRLNLLREEAASEITQLEQATGEQFEMARDEVTNALSTFSARLTEAETEYETTAPSGTESTTSEEAGDEDMPAEGTAAKQ